MTGEKTQAADALLLVSTHCPHCASVLASATELLKEGALGHLEIFNLDQRPEVAADLGVRSVPWMRIGPFELTGRQSKGDLQGWIEKVNDPQGMAAYFAELIADRQVAKVVSLLKDSPALFPAILTLLGDPDTELGVRVGLGVVMEEFDDTDVLREQLPALVELTRHEDARIRGDACYYLGFTRSGDARPALEACMADTVEDVRESAEDALEMLGA